LVVLVILSISSVAQESELERMLTRRRANCFDIHLNSVELIPRYYRENKVDSVWAVLDYWEKRCGTSEHAYRLRTLLKIKGDSLGIRASGYKFLELAQRYRWYATEYFDSERYYDTRGVVYSTSFDSLTIEIASELKSKKLSSSIDSFYVALYSNEPEVWFYLDRELEEYSGLQQQYLSEVDRYNSMMDWHYEFIAGVWVPFGKLKLVGLHPSLGFALGVKYKKVLIDGSMIASFIDSPNEYNIIYKGNSVSTKRYFRWYLGIEGGYEVFRKKRHEIDAIGGIAYDGFQAHHVKNADNDPDAVWVGTLNLNTGLGYRFYVKNFSFIGIDVRFNYTEYRNEGGTNLSGNVLTAALKYGWSGNRLKRSGLERLGKW
jgi:hypothetical protein